MADSPDYDQCTAVTDFCTVDHTIYGYRPNLGANVFFVTVFAIVFLVTLAQGIKYRSLWYNWWIAVGAFGELAGFAGRIVMHKNPFSLQGFQAQIAALIFSPSFFAAAIYLTLKHMVRAVGPEFSPIRPSLYAWIFIICDLISLLLQAAGGGVAAGANDNKTSKAGGDIMLSGIIFQVITFTFLYSLLAWVSLRMRQAKKRGQLKPAVLELLRSHDFRVFAACIFVASVALYIRGIYRIAELAGGWASSIMRKENEYIVLDNAMVALAAILLCIAHPGMWFKGMLTKQYPADHSATRGDAEKMTHSDSSDPTLADTTAPAMDHSRGAVNA